MISKLSGILDSVHDGFLTLDVQGVGYQVFASSSTLAQCTGVGEPLSLLIDTHVKEDYIKLFGFRNAAEQEWFRLLTSVQGVGAKAAMAILTACPPDQIGFAIAAGDKPAIQRADGVGPKLAARILTELKDKAGKIDLQIQPKALAKAPANESAGGGVDQDAVSALINLGYQRTDAYAAVMNVKANAENDNIELSEMIRLSLQELSL
jgi:Holliday junction DNA helicase RuvA